MKISEEQLKALVLRVLRELEAEQGSRDAGKEKQKQNLYMVCMSPWNGSYAGFLGEMDHCDTYDIYPVIPLSWKKQGYEALLAAHPSCKGIRYRSCEKPPDLGRSVTVFPVVPRDMLVKAALCISDTFETSWLGSCIGYGSRAILLRSGLERFSGREPAAYVERIMGYYRQVLEYGIEIQGMEELAGPDGIWGQRVIPNGTSAQRMNPDRTLGQYMLPGAVSTALERQGKRRVITASNVGQFARGGVITLYPGDIVTDLARDRAKFLNIVIKSAG